MEVFSQLISKVSAQSSSIPSDRTALLDEIAQYIRSKLEKGETVKMNFICTENSRRSHLAHLLAAAIVYHFKLPVQTFSGGTKVSACNPRTVAALQRAGFDIDTSNATSGETNPRYKVVLDASNLSEQPIFAYSKLYTATENPRDSFIAIMCCGNADANCPFIPNAAKRFAVTFDDPKVSDDTPLETATYDRRLLEIGSQFYYLFNAVVQK
eukprot:m.141207 g.141207  ORF g.141207 m.141207 type:complete len:211 (-) comp30168_c0_seq1:1193-1825(-)